MSPCPQQTADRLASSCAMVPIEIDLARKVVNGKAVTGVTREAVVEINSKHADGGGRTKRSCRLGLR